MKLITYFFGSIIFALFALPALGQGNKASLEKNAEALSLIRETAVAMCGSFQNSGHTTGYTVEGDAKAKVVGLLKKLSDVGLSIGGKLNESNYVGVLQKDLSENNKSVSSCNVKIFEDLLFLLKGGAVSSAPDRKITDGVALTLDECGNSVIYYEKLSEPMVLRPQSVWTCKSFERRRIATDRAGLRVSERLALDQYRGKIELVVPDSLLRWSGVNKPIFSLGVKNAGASTVSIRSIDLLASSAVHNQRNDFFPNTFVIYPGQEILVPIAGFTELAKLVDTNYDDTEYTYTVSMSSDAACHMDAEPKINTIYSCTGRSIGFAVSIKFTDIFGDQYRLNTPAFVRKQKWEGVPLTALN